MSGGEVNPPEIVQAGVGASALIRRVRHPELRVGALFLISSLTFQGARFAATLLAAAMLGPADFGQWALVVAVLAYTPYATVGVVNAINREVPIYLGAQRAEQAHRSEEASVGASIVAGVILLVGLAIAGYMLGTPPLFSLAVGVAAGFQQLAFCYQATLRARIRFREAALVQFAMAGVFLVLAVPGLVWGGLTGLLAAQAASYALATILCALWLRRDLRPTLPLPVLRGQVRSGLPIAIGGLAFAGLTSQDRWVVALTGTPVELGRYGFASTMASGLILIVLIVAQQMYPRMGFAYGRSGRAAATQLAGRQSIIAGGTTALAALALVAGTGVLVAFVLAKYGGSITPLVVLSVAAFVLGLASGATNLLLVVDRAWRLVVVYATGTIVGFVSGYLLTMVGVGIVAPAIGTMIGAATVAITAGNAVRK